MTLRTAEQWVSKMDAYGENRDLFRTKAITEAQTEVLESVLLMIQEASADEFSAGRESAALKDLEEKVRAMIPERVRSPGW